MTKLSEVNWGKKQQQDEMFSSYYTVICFATLLCIVLSLVTDNSASALHIMEPMKLTTTTAGQQVQQ